MKIVYFCALEDIPLDNYPNHCKLLRELDTRNMPASDEYSSYVNAVSGKEMLMAIKDHIKMKFLCDIRASPFYSLLIDESTDHTIQKHFIIYALYVTNAGKGPIRCVFIELLSVENVSAKCIFDIVNKFLQDNMLDICRLIAIATDGASVMVGHKRGVIARFQESMPHILGVHCIAHRQALAAKDGFVTHPYVYAFVDKVANKVYSWLGKSSKRHDELWKIMSDYDIVDMRALQIHSVRWLSRGQVMERLVNIMPAILMQWQRSEKKWYKNITIFSVQFMIHFLADVLKELNKLNMEFQRHEMDVTTIGAMIDLIVEKLRRRYIDVDAHNFGLNSPCLSSFLKMARDSMLSYEDANGNLHKHALRFESIPMDANKRKEIGSLEECICMAKIYVKNILESLDRRPSSYPSNITDRERMTHEWLNRIINRLNIDTHMIDIRKCMNEREDFVGMLCRVAEHKSMHDAWKAYIDTKSWWDLYPEMMKVWQIALVIPASTSACERGFSRQNFIKSTSRSSLGLDTLDALMLLSIDARRIHHIDWEDTKLFTVHYD
ncbi:hypothetical protein KP509_18G002600 [Ceratopteris richardii]|uniref:HAT C-terminal dimerisation domain-containing protein n=1 Tax=Ceratopteris richardii TaxID=49495 RepID=A0A8T2SP39_CERRI|nr:hypothetical protein KP509_18G002600 [Ceratopteris richardii]